MKRRSLFRNLLLGSSRVLFDVAVVGLLFVGHQLWLTDLLATRDQRSLLAAYETQVLGADATRAAGNVDAAGPAPSTTAGSAETLAADLAATDDAFSAEDGFATDPTSTDASAADGSATEVPSEISTVPPPTIYFGPSSGPYAQWEPVVPTTLPAVESDSPAPSEPEIAILLGPLPARIPDPVLAADAAPAGVLGIIEIPRLGVRQVIQDGIDADRLKQGTGLFRSAPPPGSLGNVVIAGHRTTYGKPFYNIDRLSAGDEIILTTQFGRWVYHVEWQRVVDPSNREVTAQDLNVRELTLVSCHPRYSARKRFIVRAIVDRQAPPPPTQTLPRVEASPSPGTELATATFDEGSGSPTIAPPSQTYWWLRFVAIVSVMLALRFFIGALIAYVGWRPWVAKLMCVAPIVVLLWFLFAAGEHLVPSQI